jgi:hypothetical protein
MTVFEQLLPEAPSDPHVTVTSGWTMKVGYGFQRASGVDWETAWIGAPVEL